MTTGANNFAFDIINYVPYQSISNGGVQSAISTLATQLSTYRSQGTAVEAVGVLRDLIEDVLRRQGGQVVETIIVPAANCELTLSDPTAVTALTTIRSYLTGLSTANVLPEGALVSKQSFVTLSACSPTSSESRLSPH